MAATRSQTPTEADAPPPPPPPPPIETSVDLWDPFGQPGELRAAADAWDAMAARLEDMTGYLGGVVDGSASDWSGQARDAFVSHWQEMSSEMGNGADGMREVATQLRAMADELEAKNDLIQSIYVAIAATAGVSLLAGLVSFGAGWVAGSAAVATQVARAERVLAAVKAYIVASRGVMAAARAAKVGAFAMRFVGFTAQGAAVTATVKQVALDQDPFDPDNWSTADLLGVGAGGFTSAGLALRGVRLAGTPGRALASGFAADAGTSALVDVLGGNARPGQIFTNALLSGTTGAALNRGAPRRRAEPPPRTPAIPTMRPSARHDLSRVGQGSVAKNRNTVVEPGVDVRADVDAINRGKADPGRSATGDPTYTVNGRTYGVHDDGRLYPIEGPGLQQLSRQEFKALGVYNKFGDSPRANQILDAMGADESVRARALEVWKKGQR